MGGAMSALGCVSGALLPGAPGASLAAKSDSGLLDRAGRPRLRLLPLALALAAAVGPELVEVGADTRRIPRHLAALAKMWKDAKFGNLPSW